MKRWKQYVWFIGLVAVSLAAGLWGFSATGGALPWAKRSARALQEGVREGGGAVVDFGRGVVVAGPIRSGGMMAEFVGLVVVFAVIGIGLYVYVDRYRGLDDERAAR